MWCFEVLSLIPCWRGRATVGVSIRDNIFFEEEESLKRARGLVGVYRD